MPGIRNLALFSNCMSRFKTPLTSRLITCDKKLVIHDIHYRWSIIEMCKTYSVQPQRKIQFLPITLETGEYIWDVKTWNGTDVSETKENRSDMLRSRQHILTSQNSVVNNPREKYHIRDFATCNLFKVILARYDRTWLYQKAVLQSQPAVYDNLYSKCVILWQLIRHLEIFLSCWCKLIHVKSLSACWKHPHYH